MNFPRLPVDLAALAAAEERAAVMRVLIDPGGRLLKTTARLCDWLGHARDGLNGVPFESLVDAGDRTLFRRALQSLCDGAEEATLAELRLCTASGGLERASLDLTAAREPGGPLLSLLGFIRRCSDEEEQVRARLQAADREAAARRQSEYLLQRILEAVPVGVWVADRDGHITLSNAASRAIWDAERLVSLDQYGQFKAWWPDTGKPLAPAEWGMARAITHGEVSRDEVLEIETFAGARKTILNSAAPLLDDAGNRIGAIAINLDVTERRRLEQELRLSEKRFREAFAEAPIGMALIDLDGRFQYVNRAYRELTGYDEQELLAPSVTFSSLTHPDDRSDNVVLMDRLTKGELPAVFYEKRYVRKDGTPIWVRVSASLRRDEEGRPYQVLGLIEDVNERKRTEDFLLVVLEREQVARQEAEEARNILDALMEHVPEGIAITDASGVNVRRVSRYGQQLAGRPDGVAAGGPEQEQGTPWGIYCPDGVTPAPPERLPLARATAAGEVVRNEVWLLRDAGGTNVPILCNAAPIRDRAGRVTGGILVWRDIRELQEKEAALRESEERFRALADNIAQLAWMTDGEGRRFWFNKRWFDYTGTDPAATADVGWRQVHHPDHLGRVSETMSRAFATGSDWEDTFPLRGKDGRYRWFLSRAVPIRDAQGRVVRWFGTNTDVTALLEAEAALRAKSDELMRTNAELEQFAYVASHDLRAPLRAVANLARWIEEDLGEGVDPENRERLRLLHDRVMRMDQLINGLLTYARLGRPPPRPEPVPLAPLLKGLIDELALPSTFRLVIEEPLPALAADPIHLRQIFQNLISNAVDHHDRGSGTVWIRARDEEPLWRVEVADDGPGIPPSARDGVFNMFSSTASGHHTGIGLAVVKKLVTSYGGSVTASDNTPRGALFRICWPKSG